MTAPISIEKSWFQEVNGDGRLCAEKSPAPISIEKFWFRGVGLLWLHFSEALPCRIYLSQEIGERAPSFYLAEIPGQTQDSVISLPQITTLPWRLRFHRTKNSFGIVLADGPPLEPQLVDDGGFAFRWKRPANWSRVRVQRLAWNDGRLTLLPYATEVAAGDLSFRPRNVWTTTGHTEWLFTPIDANGGQGATETLIVPPQPSRIVTTFLGVRKNDRDARSREHLVVQFRRLGETPEPSGTVRWRFIRDKEWEVRPFEIKWQEGTAHVVLDLITWQDKVEVAFDRSTCAVEGEDDGTDFVYETCLFDKDSNKPVTQRLEGVSDPRLCTYTYRSPWCKDCFAGTVSPLEKQRYFPELAQLIADSPLTALLAQGNCESLLSLPSAIAMQVYRYGDRPNLACWHLTLSALGVPFGAALEAYLHRAQDFELLLGHADLLESVARNDLQLPTERLSSRALVSQCLSQVSDLSPDRVRTLCAKVQEGGEPELDFWIEALAIGVPISWVEHIRYNLKWECKASELRGVYTRYQQLQTDPLGTLWRELIPGLDSPVHRAVSKAMRLGERALRPDAKLEEVDLANDVRKHAATLLGKHLEDLTNSRSTHGPWSSLEKVKSLLEFSSVSGQPEVGCPSLNEVGKQLCELREKLAILEEEEREIQRWANAKADAAVPCCLRIDAIWLAQVEAQTALLEHVAGWCYQLCRTSRLPAWPIGERLPMAEVTTVLLPAWNSFSKTLADLDADVRIEMVAADIIQTVRVVLESVESSLRQITALHPKRNTVGEIMQALNTQSTGLVRLVHGEELRKRAVRALESRLGEAQNDTPADKAALHFLQECRDEEPWTDGVWRRWAGVMEMLMTIHIEEQAWRALLARIRPSLQRVFSTETDPLWSEEPLGEITNRICERGDEWLNKSKDHCEQLRLLLCECEGICHRRGWTIPQMDSPSANPAMSEPVRLLYPKEFALVLELWRLGEQSEQLNERIKHVKEVLKRRVGDKVQDWLAAGHIEQDEEKEVFELIDRHVDPCNPGSLDYTVELAERAARFLANRNELLRMKHDDEPKLPLMLQCPASKNWCVTDSFVEPLRELCNPDVKLATLLRTPELLKHFEAVIDRLLAGGPRGAHSRVKQLRTEMCEEAVSAFIRAAEELGPGHLPHRVEHHSELRQGLQWLELMQAKRARGELPKGLVEKLIAVRLLV